MCLNITGTIMLPLKARTTGEQISVYVWISICAVCGDKTDFILGISSLTPQELNNIQP